MTIDELAASLQVSFRAPIAEADEWRPLAQYIVQLLEAQREACASMAREYFASDNKLGDRLGKYVRATPLVTEEKP